MPPITILVVDDFEPFRRFACPILEREAGLCIIGEASDGLEAVQKIEELQPDLILLDIGLPGLNGIEVARRVGKLAPHARILTCRCARGDSRVKPSAAKPPAMAMAAT